MHVHVESIGLPALSALWGGRIELFIRENTIYGLIDALAREYGDRARKILLDRDGKLDPEILVMVNESEVVGRKAAEECRLAEGDSIKFILMVGGG